MKKKNDKSEEEEIDPNAWMITFSDLLTLMLTFFVMLLTMSAMDTKKLNETFGVFKTGGRDVISGKQGGLMDLPFKQVPKRKMSEDAEGLGALFAKLARDAERRFTDFSEQEANELKNIIVKHEVEEIIVYLPVPLLFKQQKANMNHHAGNVLDLLGNWAKNKIYNVKIEGHTDNTIINTIEFPSNWELSVTRAVNIMRYFLDNKYIESEKISAYGYNEFQPLEPNNSEENRLKNRRIEIVFKKPI